MRPAVSCIPCATYSKEQTGDIITLAQFKEWDLLSETCNDAESSDKSDYDLIIPPLLNEEEMYAMDSGDELDDKPMFTDILEDIRDRSQSRPKFNRKKSRFNICSCIKQR